MRDLNLPDRCLLGTSGWERADGLTDYYPEDLPAEWRLAYYANDCDGVLLPATRWRGRVAGLDAGVRAVIIDGPGVHPGKLPELRILFDLLDGPQG